MERVAAAVGLLDGAPIEFERVADVPDGGVLFALPALLLYGLLDKSREIFSMPEGFYPLESIFLLLALMALARIPSLEALRYVAPGEWGKLIGLDRIPEVRTLRQKVSALCSERGRAERWSGLLAKQWMEGEAESAGVFYADGHVRLYHGKLTDLPRRYVARERLCLRGITDYWVNAMDGQPFFVVTYPVDPGLLSVLEHNIVPRLRAEAPSQPSEQELEANSLLSRFSIVFDREGYSPKFFARMKEQRIAVLTYHKYPGEAWPEHEFRTHRVRLVNGEEVSLQLAERGVRLSNDLWVREVRQRSESGAQSSILSTDYRSDLSRVAVAMFARWWPLKTGGKKSSNSKHSAKRLLNISYCRTCPSKSAFNSCGQRKNTSSIRSSSLLTGPKQPWPSWLARKCTASMMPVHSFANCSTPKSISFPTSKTKPLRCACIRLLPKFMTRSSGISAKN